jgi:hypothetical protein
MLWIDQATTESERIQRRKKACQVTAEIQRYVEEGEVGTNGKIDSTIDAESKSSDKTSAALAYMDLFLEALRPKEPPKKIRKAKSAPCILSPM